jgi:hypothetical protein
MFDWVTFLPIVNFDDAYYLPILEELRQCNDDSDKGDKDEAKDEDEDSNINDNDYHQKHH